MTHLPYILAAYGMTFCCVVVLSLRAIIRLKQAQKKLIEIKKLQS